MLPDIFCEARITQIPKSHNEITKKKKKKEYELRQKILNQVGTKQLQQNLWII